MCAMYIHKGPNVFDYIRSGASGLEYLECSLFCITGWGGESCQQPIVFLYIHNQLVPTLMKAVGECLLRC